MHLCVPSLHSTDANRRAERWAHGEHPPRRRPGEERRTATGAAGRRRGGRRAEVGPGAAGGGDEERWWVENRYFAFASARLETEDFG